MVSVPGVFARAENVRKQSGQESFVTSREP